MQRLTWQSLMTALSAFVMPIMLLLKSVPLSVGKPRRLPVLVLVLLGLPGAMFVTLRLRLSFLPLSTWPICTCMVPLLEITMLVLLPLMTLPLLLLVFLDLLTAMSTEPVSMRTLRRLPGTDRVIMSFRGPS